MGLEQEEATVQGTYGPILMANRNLIIPSGKHLELYLYLLFDDMPSENTKKYFWVRIVHAQLTAEKWTFYRTLY